MEWFDADLELKVTSGNTTVIQDPNIVPYIREGVMGLMIMSSFLDTTFGCFIDGVELGNTSLIIYPKYLVLEESQGWLWRKYLKLLFTDWFIAGNVILIISCHLHLSFCMPGLHPP